MYPLQKGICTAETLAPRTSAGVAEVAECMRNFAPRKCPLKSLRTPRYPLKGACTVGGKSIVQGAHAQRFIRWLLFADNQDCLRKALEVYKTDTDAIIAEVVSLRSPSEALIRMRDNYAFIVKDTKARGKFEVVNTYWREANEHVIQVAAKYHIPVARSYAAFGGPNGDEDPVDKGYVSDGFHPTEDGADILAELFRKLGYDYAPKP